jgi:hypothetical protein
MNGINTLVRRDMKECAYSFSLSAICVYSKKMTIYSPERSPHQKFMDHEPPTL